MNFIAYYQLIAQEFFTVNCLVLWTFTGIAYPPRFAAETYVAYYNLSASDMVEQNNLFAFFYNLRNNTEPSFGLLKNTLMIILYPMLRGFYTSTAETFSSSNNSKSYYKNFENQSSYNASKNNLSLVKSENEVAINRLIKYTKNTLMVLIYYVFLFRLNINHRSNNSEFVSIYDASTYYCDINGKLLNWPIYDRIEFFLMDYIFKLILFVIVFFCIKCLINLINNIYLLLLKNDLSGGSIGSIICLLGKKTYSQTFEGLLYSNATTIYDIYLLSILVLYKHPVFGVIYSPIRDVSNYVTGNYVFSITNNNLLVWIAYIALFFKVNDAGSTIMRSAFALLMYTNYSYGFNLIYTILGGIIKLILAIVGPIIIVPTIIIANKTGLNVLVNYVLHLLATITPDKLYDYLTNNDFNTITTTIIILILILKFAKLLLKYILIPNIFTPIGDLIQSIAHLSFYHNGSSVMLGNVLQYKLNRKKIIQNLKDNNTDSNDNIDYYVPHYKDYYVHNQLTIKELDSITYSDLFFVLFWEIYNYVIKFIALTIITFVQIYSIFFIPNLIFNWLVMNHYLVGVIITPGL